MKNIFKFLFVSILGFVLVACGGPKNDYKLEGKYSINKVEYLDGNEIFKSNSNVEITRKGDIYTVKGKKIELIKDYEKNIFTKEIKFGSWREYVNNDFVFTGKLIEEGNEEGNHKTYKPTKLYVWKLADDKGNTLNIMIYKDSKVREAIENVNAQLNNLKGALYTGKDTNDIINLNSNNSSILKYNLTAIRDN